MKELENANDQSVNHFTNRRYSPPWLPNTLKMIQNNKDIIVTEADKNMGVVVMKTSDYIKHGLQQLQNQNTYLPCEEKPNFDSLWNDLKFILNKYKLFEYTDHRTKEVKQTALAKYLLQLYNRKELKLGTFYLLMKVHKTPVAGRPIVSSINTVTYFASKYIDRKLQPIYKSIPSFLKSSQDLIADLEMLKLINNENCYILCADVDSLYPNIPTKEGLLMMKQSITNRNAQVDKADKLTMEEISLLCDLMQFVLNNNYFSFGNLVFKQIDGTAMGTPAAVVFACLFLDSHETRIFEETQIKRLLYKRYIDDIFAIFETKEAAEIFISRFSNDARLPTIKCSNFTISNQDGVFLDLKIFKGNRFASTSIFDIKTYQKPQNKYLYLPLNSFHPKAIFPAYIVSELNRYRLTCNNDNDFDEIKEDFFKRLQARGYPSEFLTPLFLKVKTRTTLLQALYNRIRQKKGTQASNSPTIFKTLYTPQTKAMKLKQCLELTEPMNERREGIELCNRKNPIICYSNTPSIQSYFSQTRKKLHDLPLKHHMNLDIENITKFIETVVTDN